jgi:hypothetical protein
MCLDFLVTRVALLRFRALFFFFFFFFKTQDIALRPDCFKFRLPPGGAGVGFGPVNAAVAVEAVAAVATMSDKTTKR